MKPKNPTLVIDAGTIKKVQQYCNNAYDPKAKGKKYLKEISGMGLVYPTTGGDLLWSEAMLMPQESGYGHTDFDQDAVLDVMHELIQGGREETLDHLWLWWHSHVSGGTEPSFIDEGTIEDWHKGGQGKLVTVVTNIHGEITAQYDQWSPVRLSIPLNYKVRVEYKPEEVEDSLLEEIEKNVTWGSHTWSWRPWGTEARNRDKGKKKGDPDKTEDKDSDYDEEFDDWDRELMRGWSG